MTKEQVGKIGAYKVDEVLQHFIVAALWTTNDDEDEPLKTNYFYDDIPESELDKLRNLIVEFIEQNQKTLKKHNITAEALGHDLFLDSQGSGVGFRDRGYGNDGATLSKSASKIFASDQPYIGDDKKIYF